MSSRASEIMLFLILAQASIGFVNATGLFTHNYYATPQNQYNYQIQNLSEYNNAQNPQPIDYLTEIASWGIAAFFLGMQMIFAVITIFPLLVWTFHIPVILATFLQVGVYYVYMTWYVQWKSGKGWKLYE